MIRNRGLTLVEILVAILILAVGVLGAMYMQTTGLQATRTSQVIQALNADARSQLDLMRLRLARETWTAQTTGGCNISGASECSVTIQPCTVSSGQLDCSLATVSDPAAYHVTVTVRAEGDQLELDSVVLRSED